MYVTLRSSTCFEQHAAHPQEDKLYHHSLWYRHPLKAAVQYAGGERTAVHSPPAYCTASTNLSLKYVLHSVMRHECKQNQAGVSNTDGRS